MSLGSEQSHMVSADRALGQASPQIFAGSIGSCPGAATEMGFMIGTHGRGCSSARRRRAACLFGHRWFGAAKTCHVSLCCTRTQTCIQLAGRRHIIFGDRHRAQAPSCSSAPARVRHWGPDAGGRQTASCAGGSGRVHPRARGAQRWS